MRKVGQIGRASRKVAQSWHYADRDERGIRMRAVRALAVELERVEADGIFATRIAEIAIEEVIQGDWRAASVTAEILTFDDEIPEVRERESARFAGFVLLLRAFVDEHRALVVGRRGGSN